MPSPLHARDLLSIADLTRTDVEAVLDLAGAAKQGADLGKPLAGHNIAMVFQQPSNRTRVSFEVAIQRLGGHPIPIFGMEIQLGERESVRDIGRILDRYIDGIVARLVSHRDLVDLAQSAVHPVVSGMTRHEHPCQVLADLLTVREVTGGLSGVPVAYVGDGNNVCTSWLYGAALCGIDLRVLCPPGYEPAHEVVAHAATLRGKGVPFLLTHDRDQALEGAEIIYTDVWTSTGQEGEAVRRREDFAGLQVNADLVSRARPSARVMHCLPAHRGEEITDDVLDGPQAIVFDQAENRLWAQQALLALIFGP